MKQRAVSVAAMGAGHHGMLRVEGVRGDGHTGGKPGGMSHFHQVSRGSRGLKGRAHLTMPCCFVQKEVEEEIGAESLCYLQCCPLLLQW